jgi:hypothetical protein
LPFRRFEKSVGSSLEFSRNEDTNHLASLRSLAEKTSGTVSLFFSTLINPIQDSHEQTPLSTTGQTNPSSMFLNRYHASIGVKTLPTKGVFRLRSMFVGKSRRLARIQGPSDEQRSDTLSPIDESSDESSSSSSSSSSAGRNNPTMIEAYATLLSSDDVDDNRTGLEKLLEASKSPRLLDTTNQIHDLVSYAIVYGGEDGSVEELLRSCLLLFLCDDNGNDDDFSVFSDYDDDRDDDDEAELRGKNLGALHLLSLQLIARSLEKILASDYSDSEPESINFEDPFWANAVATLIHNIEMLPDADITGHSLKCMRLLHSLEPILVKQMLQQSLMPYIIHLKEYGENQKLPMIESEASRLLKRAEIQATRYITI